MKTARRIAVNFLSLSVSEVISKILQLVVFVYLARFFGKAEFGKFGFALAFATIASVLADFGINMLLIREISIDKKNAKKYVSSAFAIKIMLSVITFLAAFSYLNFMKYDAGTKSAAYVILLFMVIGYFTDLFYSVFRAFERMHFDSSIKLARAFLLLALVFLATYYSKSLVNVLWMFPITEALMFLLSITIYMAYFRKTLDFAFDWNFSRKLLMKAFPFFISMIFVYVLIYVDALILERMKGAEQVGIYTAAFNILFGLTFIPLMYSNAVYPVFSRYFVEDKNLLRFAYRKSFQYMLLLGLPICIWIFVYADKIVSLVYGAGYGESAAAIRILCFFVLLRFVNIVPGTALSSINRQSSRTIGQGIVASINIILNFALIPKYGFVGAAIATVASESFFILLYLYFTSKYSLRLEFKELIKPLAAAAAMALVIFSMPSIYIGFFAGAVSYAVMLFLLGAVGKEDKKLLVRIMRDN